jgi:hypothetical protein
VSLTSVHGNYVYIEAMMKTYKKKDILFHEVHFK